jgi:Leucine-rich repeat (LRR) protein
MKKLYPLLSVLFLIYWGCEEEQDTIPPTVSISSHSSGQNVNEIITITVTTQDNEGISKVEFFIDDSLVLTDTESPYQYDWNTTQYEDNSEHIVKVVSYDNSDNSTTSQPIMLTVDNSGSYPTPSVLYPITYNDGFQISWSQNTDDDFVSYKLYESPPSEDMSNWTLVYETTEREDTNYVVTGISEDRYYQITTEDVWGFQSISDIGILVCHVELWGLYYSIEYTTEINLSNRGLTGEIPSEIGNLTNLTSLYLGSNQLTGSIPSEIGNMTNLTYLSLYNNELTGSIPPEIGNLTNLTYLNLSGNLHTGSIPPEIGNLTNLTYLYLYSNDLTGSIPSEIGNLTNLTDLSLGYNELTGEIPPEIGNLTNLERLKLRDNDITGSIPPEIGNLTNLIRLYLDENQLTGSIPPEIGNLTNLEWLDLSGNGLTGSIPPEIGNLTNLSYLDLRWNQLTGEIPSEIGNLTNLTSLYLGSNQLTGEIPESICNLVENNCWISINNNQLCPPYPSCIEDNVGGQDLINCDGVIELWGEYYSIEYTTEINLSNRGLTGEIPESICDLNIDWGNNNYFNISNNQLCPPYPSCIEDYVGEQDLINCDGVIELWGEYYSIEYTTEINLSNRGLTGEIPSEIGNLTNLTHLDLDNNQLTGSIPPEIGNLTNLKFLKLFNNELTGSIPQEIGNLVNLYLLWLYDNQLSGIIPDEICNQGDSSPSLSNNQLCPPYPSCIENNVGTQDTSDCP